nr:expressed protein [Hymenolepis microstoma]CUU97684.1 hypothetical transcript [Hymenolepis microstoma]CUU97686.1 hypothetical transcript [Hymenolepis microstoma]CUU97688.1 hypothetical transcript [Hymenolepis microstoma]
MGIPFVQAIGSFQQCSVETIGDDVSNGHRSACSICNIQHLWCDECGLEKGGVGDFGVSPRVVLDAVLRLNAHL